MLLTVLVGWRNAFQMARHGEGGAEAEAEVGAEVEVGNN